MNPIQMFTRGFKTGVSNLGMVWLYLGVLVAMGLLMVAPIVVFLMIMGFGAVSSPGGALESLADHWALYAGGTLFMLAWLTIVFLGYFYFEAGLRGLVARAHRQAPEDDFSLRPRFGSAEGFRVFRFDAWLEEARCHGWRVTVLATVYAAVATLALAVVLIPAVYGFLQFMNGDRGTVVWVCAALTILLFLLFVLAGIAISLHYQCAVTWAVLNRSGWREAVRAATALIRARPLEFLALFGLSLAGGMVLAAAFTLLSMPLVVLSVIPGLALLLLPVRLLLTLCQYWFQGLLQVTVMGAYTAYCAPLPAAAPATAAPVSPEPIG